MTLFSKIISIRWSDIDPNFHMRHSAYYDFGAQQRIEIIESLGLTLQLMQQQNFGPILFREECVFKKEIRLSDTITLHCRLARRNADVSRWTIQHEFTAVDNKSCAIITVDGAWIDTRGRKLLSPIPKIITDIFDSFPLVEQP
ncbi:MAG TPA: acyl-CoA thioesterase [Puia sp.]|nr:acyl-CoA thioesterase [Puia sp.]